MNLRSSAGFAGAIRGGRHGGVRRQARDDGRKGGAAPSEAKEATL